MLVSVVMSVFNAECFLRESISSILNQTYTGFEFIIINDGSTDGSIDIIKAFQDPRIILIDQPNKGLSKSLNIGISQASGKYIARMDADDISEPERLQKQVDYLNNNSNCVMVGSQASLIDKDGNFLYKSRNPELHEEIIKKLPDSSFFHSSVIFRKEAWEICKGYQEDIVHHFEDKLLWNKFSSIGELHNLNEALIRYRILPFSISNADPDTNQKVKKISDKLIETGDISEEELKKLEGITAINKKKRLGNYYQQLGAIYLKENFNRSKAFGTLVKSLSYTYTSLNVYINLFLCFLPKSLVLQIKNRKKSR